MAAVTIVGLGNIGSHLVLYLVRNMAIDTIILVDHDRVSKDNLTTQNVDAGDVGRYKVDVVIKALKRIRLALRVRGFYKPVEQLPIGVLTSDVIVGCLDNLIGRQYLNQVAWRVGVPYVDGGVNAAQNLCRINVYDPRQGGAACMECGWSGADYGSLEQRHACQAALSLPSTGAPAALGALAAALQAAEVGKLLEDGSTTLANRQVLYDIKNHRHFVVQYDRNPQCRFDHHTWPNIKTIPLTTRLNDLLKNASDRFYFEGWKFVTRLVCSRCEHVSKPMLRLTHRLHANQSRCRHCGGTMISTAAHILHTLSKTNVSAQWLDRPLNRLGLVKGDIAIFMGNGKQAALLLGD